MLLTFINVLFLSFMAHAEPAAVSTEAIHEALKQEIDKIIHISNDYDIELSTSKINLVPQTEDDVIQVKNLSFESGTHHFHGFLNTRAGADKTPDIQIRGTLNLIMDIPVVTRVINPDEEILEADISWQKMPLAKVGQDTIQSKDDLIGKVPKRQAIKPGIILRKSDLRAPILIHNKQPVTITYVDEGLTLSTGGEAKQDGAKGDLIRVALLNSKKDIQARVKAKGQVEIRAVGSSE